MIVDRARVERVEKLGRVLDGLIGPPTTVPVLAQRLGLAVKEVRESLAELQQLGKVQRDDVGRFMASVGPDGVVQPPSPPPVQKRRRVVRAQFQVRVPFPPAPVVPAAEAAPVARVATVVPVAPVAPVATLVPAAPRAVAVAPVAVAPAAGSEPAKSDVNAVSGAPGRSSSRLTPFLHLLGVKSDREVAELAGLQRDTVKKWRQDHGIAAKSGAARRAEAPAAEQKPTSPVKAVVPVKTAPIEKPTLDSPAAAPEKTQAPVPQSTAPAAPMVTRLWVAAFDRAGVETRENILARDAAEAIRLAEHLGGTLLSVTIGLRVVIAG